MAFPTDIDGTWIDAGASLDAGELRRADAGIFNSDGSAYGAVGGVVRHSTAALVTIDGSDNVTILPQPVVIPGNPSGATTPAVGVYRAALPASVTNPLLTARNATNPRVDLVVAQALDASVTGSTDTIRFTLVTGTAASSPSAPTLPFMAVELARINIPAVGGGPATVDLSFRKFATAIGAPLMVPSFARLPTTGLAFQRAQAMDTGVYYDWNGTAWVSQAPHFRGTILSATGLSANANVTFAAQADTDNGWATNLYTVKRAGVYRVAAQFKWNGSPPTLAFVAFHKNGTRVFQGPAASATSFGGMNAFYEVGCAVNDTLSVQTGVAFTTQSDSPADNNTFAVNWIRP